MLEVKNQKKRDTFKNKARLRVLMDSVRQAGS